VTYVCFSIFILFFGMNSGSARQILQANAKRVLRMVLLKIVKEGDSNDVFLRELSRSSQEFPAP
jgi:hypothetical protein